MRNKSIHYNNAVKFLLAAMTFIAVPLLFGGCALTENGGRLALEELPDQEARLAGIYVTRTPIEPGLPALELNSRGEIVAKDIGPERIYGSHAEHGAGESAVTFPGLEGYGIYSLTAPGDGTHEAAGDRYMTCDLPFANVKYNVSDQETAIEADFYVSAHGSVRCYFNPVYQQADGQIYLLAGSGVSSDSFVDGQKFSHGISESVSRQSNGEESARTLRFTVNIVAAGQPRETELVLMDGENRLVERYSEEQLEELADSGESLALPAEAAYVILRQAVEGKERDSRRLFDRDAEYVEYMASGQDGCLYFRHLPLVWP